MTAGRMLRTLARFLQRLCRDNAMSSRKRVPRCGLIDDPVVLRQNADRLLAASQRRGVETSIVVFDFSDLLEVRRIYGRRVAAALFRLILAKLAEVAGREGIAACTGPALFAVVLPKPLAEAMHAVHLALGEPAHVEHDSAIAEIVLVPNYVADVVKRGESFQYRYEAIVCALAARNAREQNWLRHIRRARERHSRPGVLQCKAPQSEVS